MEIDLERLRKERRISMTKLARQEDVAVPTTWRWYKQGVRGIYLETFMVGGRRFSTQEAFHRFVAATTDAANGERPTPTSPTNRQRQAAIARAEARADADDV